MMLQKTTIMGIALVVYAVAGVVTGHLDWSGFGAAVSAAAPLIGLKELGA